MTQFLELKNFIFVTAYGSPSKPILMGVEVRNVNEAHIIVSPPEGVSEDDIIAYQVRLPEESQFADPLVFRKGEPIVLTGLSPERSITAEVTMVTDEGKSPPLRAVFETEAVQVPSRPIITSPTQSNASDSYVLTWKVESNGGLPITKYIIRWKYSQDWNRVVYFTDEHFYKIQGLGQAKMYTVEIYAINAKGLSDANRLFRFYTKRILASAPSVKSVQFRCGYFTMFVDPPYTPAGTIQGYRVTVNPGNSVTDIAGTPSRIKINTPKGGTQYSIIIEAKNENGYGEKAKTSYRSVSCKK